MANQDLLFLSSEFDREHNQIFGWVNYLVIKKSTVLKVLIIEKFIYFFLIWQISYFYRISHCWNNLAISRKYKINIKNLYSLNLLLRITISVFNENLITSLKIYDFLQRTQKWWRFIMKILRIIIHNSLIITE